MRLPRRAYKEFLVIPIGLEVIEVGNVSMNRRI